MAKMYAMIAIGLLTWVFGPSAGAGCGQSADCGRGRNDPVGRDEPERPKYAVACVYNNTQDRIEFYWKWNDGSRFRSEEIASGDTLMFPTYFSDRRDGSNWFNMEWDQNFYERQDYSEIGTNWTNHGFYVRSYSDDPETCHTENTVMFVPDRRNNRYYLSVDPVR